MDTRAYEQAYEMLNAEQRTAVDQIDGPLLVIAGPGTGKTQLLSARAAHILQATDALPQNILCLTFTESGAANMRERLTRFIGKQAYDVQIGTYHSFGSDLIRRFPEYFTELRLEQPIDELGKYQLIESIVQRLSYRDPLKQTQHHLRDLIATISEVKRGLLAPDDLRSIAAENTQLLQVVADGLRSIFADFTTMPRSYDKAVGYFAATLKLLQDHTPQQPANATFGAITTLAAHELGHALAEAEAMGKTKPLTAWKNAWLVKNNQNQFVLAGGLETKRIESLAGVMEQYQAALSANGLYDFDDMILHSIDALTQHDDLRYSLHEQYLYIMLDEYQDTNAAQAKIVELLTNNPVSEGRPNVMAVGDDDQAIYAFQGAQYSNMLDFYRAYRDVQVVNLQQNYRSTPEILETAANIAGQISERLFDQLPHIHNPTKQLVAAHTGLPATKLERRDFRSDIAQYAHTARQIAELIKQGVAPDDIAVLAPQHRYLEALVAYLNTHNIPVRYEKRENILETPTIQQLLSMARLVEAIQQQHTAVANTLWPEVLSFDFWALPVADIWQTAWQINSAESAPKQWLEALINHQNSALRSIGEFFLVLASRMTTETAERMLDYLTGTTSVPLSSGDYTSPFHAFYASADHTLYDTVSQLTVLREAVRVRQTSQDSVMTLPHVIALADAYASAGQQLLNTSPYSQSAHAVQLMTAFKAKGLEFGHVFLLAVNDEVWGGSGQSMSNKLTLPANLRPIRHSGATEDERLRLFFVAITRAKHSLYLYNYESRYDGKATTRLKYLDEREAPDQTHQAYALPAAYQLITSDDADTPPEQSALETNWRAKHVAFEHDTTLKDLLSERLKNYQISPTHLNTFCDLIYAGPEQFFFTTILRFPSAPSAASQYGEAMHETLQWLQTTADEQQALPTQDAMTAFFAARMRRHTLPEHETALLIERGEHALRAYVTQRADMFAHAAVTEKNFKSEGVLIGNVHLTGKIDRLEIDKANRTITVVDYKTGSPAKASKSDPKFHKYQQQLYCYKLLVEGSHTYKGYTVTSGRLEFVEPVDTETNTIAPPIIIDFDPDEIERTKQLLTAVWRRVQALDIPDVSAYAPSMTGIRAFEQALIDEQI